MLFLNDIRGSVRGHIGPCYGIEAVQVLRAETLVERLTARSHVAKQKVIRCHASMAMRPNFENHEIFRKVTLVGAKASKIMKFARWRDFNALRRAH